MSDKDGFAYSSSNTANMHLKRRLDTLTEDNALLTERWDRATECLAKMLQMKHGASCEDVMEIIRNLSQPPVSDNTGIDRAAADVKQSGDNLPETTCRTLKQRMRYRHAR